MKINLVIPAAGQGSRFKTTGVNTPKPLIPIFGIPMIGWVIANFSLKPDDVIWIISRKEDEIPVNLKKLLPKLNFQTQFIEIDHLTDGAASTLEFAFEAIPKNEIVICANSDQYISADLTPFMKMVRAKETSGQILTMTAFGDKWSYIKRNSSGDVVEVVEKMQVSDEATVGVYGWKSVGLAANSIATMKKANFMVNGEFYVAPSYSFLINQGGDIATFNVGGIEEGVHGLGTPEDLKNFLNHPEVENYFDFVRSKLGIPQ